MPGSAIRYPILQRRTNKAFERFVPPRKEPERDVERDLLNVHVLADERHARAGGTSPERDVQALCDGLDIKVVDPLLDVLLRRQLDRGIVGEMVERDVPAPDADELCLEQGQPRVRGRTGALGKLGQHIERNVLVPRGEVDVDDVGLREDLLEEGHLLHQRLLGLGVVDMCSASSHDCTTLPEGSKGFCEGLVDHRDA